MILIKVIRFDLLIFKNADSVIIPTPAVENGLCYLRSIV